MTQRSKPEKEFLQESFLPQIAVCCSYDAEVVCRKNNLTFIELIQPFSKYNGEIKIFDPSNNPSNIKNFKIDIKDINHIDPQPIAIKKILESCMLYNAEEDTVSLSLFENHLYKITTNTCTPWFEKWRENFIKYCTKEDHEFIRNYLGCIFVVSTSHIDPLDQFQKLVIQEQTDSSQNNCKKWFFPNFVNVYKYFVLLHDVQEGEISKAHLIYESLKNSYGSSNCHLLQINSKSFENHDFDKTYPDFDPWSKYCKLRDIYKNFDSPNDSVLERNVLKSNSEQYQERHGMCLSLSDHDRIKTFYSEFLTRGLIPYAEKTIRVLNEQFQSKKNILKGFSISKKFFGLSSSSSKTSTSPIISLSNLTINPQDTSNSSSKASSTFFNSNNQFVHTNDDLNTRRLADLAFLFQLYDLSLYYYLSFKKDFASIQNSAFAGTENSFSAKLHLASVLEMASIAGHLNSVTDHSLHSNLSSFTLNKNSNTHYIEEALHIYTNECKNDSYSTRCLLFSTEMFRMISNHSKAASQLIHFYVDENDLRRSLFLEQAAYYYLIQSPPNFRKFSFLISLAGENFKKIGQDMHSVLAYKNALQGYSDKAWTKILDQINFSLSCQNQKLSNIDQALQYLGDILFKKNINMLTCAAMSRENKLSTRHNSSNESYILQKFIDFSNSLNLNNNVDLILRLPAIDIGTLKINLNPIENFYLDSNKTCINNQESLEFFQNSPNDFNDLKERWKKLEEAVCISNFGTIPSVFFKPQTGIYHSSTVYNRTPTAICNEFIEISFNLVNTLKVDLILKDCVLLWKFIKHNLNEKDKNIQISNDQDNDQAADCAEIKSIDQILIPCKSEKLVRLLIKPREQDGNLCILGMKYKLGTGGNGSKKCSEQLVGKQLFEFKEKRNNIIKKNLRPKVASVQNSLNFKIVKKMPLLQVNVDNLPEKMFCNQIHKINICLINLSEETSIGSIKIAIDKSTKSNALFKNSNLQSEGNDFDFEFENVDKEIVQNLSSLTIRPKQKVILDLWIQTNEVYEKNFFNFLIAYQEIVEQSIATMPTSKSNKLEYRTVRFRVMIENANMIYENKIRTMSPFDDSSFVGNIEINCRGHLDEMEICNIFSISKFWKIRSFKKNCPSKLKSLESIVSEKSKKISFVFKADTLNSNAIDSEKKFESLHFNLFKNDPNSHENLNNINDVIENFCQNRYKYISENNCLVLYFLIMIRNNEEKFFILKDIEFSSKTFNKPPIPNQDFNKRIHMNASQHEKLIYHCSKLTRSGSSKYQRPFVLSP